jgi:hypothetical protein
VSTDKQKMVDMRDTPRARVVDGPVPAAPNTAPVVTGVPVRLLTFTRPGGVDVPGAYGANSLRAGKPSLREWYEILYMPSLRHHRVTYHPPNNGTAQVTYIHETWCRWDPETAL